MRECPSSQAMLTGQLIFPNVPCRSLKKYGILARKDPVRSHAYTAQEHTPENAWSRILLPAPLSGGGFSRRLGADLPR